MEIHYAVIFFCVLYVVTCESASRVVYTTQGPVRGYKYENNDDIYVFYGIPYATAPTGENRFKAPLPPPVWTEPYEAVNNSIACHQSSFVNILKGNRVFQEDCLVANVYMPVTKQERLPVLVLFHGGGFFIGWSTIQGNEVMVNSKEVVVVTFNYRLGAHGFLCLGTKFAPGNAGAKDQIALLRWVKKNIASFGGDPDNVILDGLNTGSAFVDLISLSKMAKGLYKKVILESSSSMAPFSVQINPIRNARKLAEMLGFDSQDFSELENFYKNISYEQLNSKNPLGRPDSTYLMSPCIERDLGDERFLDDSPINILKSGNFEKVPMLYGFNEADGQGRLPFLGYWEYWMNILFLEFLPGDLQFDNEDEKEEVADIIKNLYFGDKTIGKKTTTEFVDYFTDVMYAYPILRAVRLQVEAGNYRVYLYEYSKTFSPNINELFANLTVSENECSLRNEIFEVIEDYVKVCQENEQSDTYGENSNQNIYNWFLNFILYEKPLPPFKKLFPPWPPVGVNGSPHMYISSSLNWSLRRSLLKKKAEIWDKIYEKHYHYPSSPTPPEDN